MEAVALVLMLHSICPTLAAFRTVKATSFKKFYVAGDNITSNSLEMGRSVIQCSDLCKTDGSQCAGFRFDGTSCYFYSAVDPALLANTMSEGKTDAFYYNPKDCHELWEIGHREAGVYRLSPPGVESFTAWCEFDNSNGWTVIQRRFDGSQDFFLYWSDYKNGFGNFNGEYWLGNDNIHALTLENHQLSIFLQKYDGSAGTANYSAFYINSEADNYRLEFQSHWQISGYSGDADDALAGGTGRNSNGASFSTRDRDNDNYSNYNCAEGYTGAWWYNACHDSNLNGIWTNSTSGGWGNICWAGNWSGGYTATIHRTTMRITRN